MWEEVINVAAYVAMWEGLKNVDANRFPTPWLIENLLTIYREEGGLPFTAECYFIKLRPIGKPTAFIQING